MPTDLCPLASTLPGGWLFVLLAFIGGACIGSFLNVCIYRIPAEESVVWPSSRCPQCETPITWYDNVPILGWLWLRARCRACGLPIPTRYPIVEALTGLLAVVAVLRFGATASALIAFAFTAALLLITYIDLDHRFIPDEVSLPGILVGLAVAFRPDGIGPWNAAAGAALGGGVLWLVAWSYERATGVEGMGFGDVKLLAMIGAFLGWQAIPGIIVIASLTGTIAGFLVIAGAAGRRTGHRVARRLGRRALLPYVRRAARRTAIPFGPFLALGAVVALYLPALALPWRIGFPG